MIKVLNLIKSLIEKEEKIIINTLFDTILNIKLKYNTLKYMDESKVSSIYRKPILEALFRNISLDIFSIIGDNGNDTFAHLYNKLFLKLKNTVKTEFEKKDLNNLMQKINNLKKFFPYRNNNLAHKLKKQVPYFVMSLELCYLIDEKGNEYTSNLLELITTTEIFSQKIINFLNPSIPINQFYNFYENNTSLKKYFKNLSE